MITLIAFVAITVNAHSPVEDYVQKPILTDITTIKALNLPLLAKDEVSGVGYTIITPEIERQISAYSHRLSFEPKSDPESSGLRLLLQ